MGYGFNKIAAMASYPLTATVGGTLQEFRHSENLRQECAAAGYSEMLLFSLVSSDTSFGDQVVEIANPKTTTFTHGRASLIPGLLRAAQHH